MSSVEEKLIKIVDNRIKLNNANLQFDKTHYGKIESVAGETCVINIGGNEYAARLKKGVAVQVGEVVMAKSPNGNFSYLYVDGGVSDQVPPLPKPKIVTALTMIADKGLRNDELVETCGYYESGDGGGCIYRIGAETDYSIRLDNGLFANIINTDSVNYRMLGAKLNGVDDDTQSLLKTHAYCNKHKVLLRNGNGTIYKTNTTKIPVKYDVDLRGSTILVDNNNCYSMYEIVNDNENFYSYEAKINKSQLRKDTNYFTMNDNSLPPNCVLHIKDNNVWCTRNDAGLIYDEYRGDMLFHNVFGYCMGSLIYGYDDDLTNLYFKYTFYNKSQLTFKGCEIKLETTPNVTIGTVKCLRHNCHISDFYINPKPNSLSNYKFKNSVITFQDCYNSEISNITGTNIAGGVGESNGSGYTIRFVRCYRINMHDCHINGFWGCTAMNSVSDIKVDNCTLNRIDIHEYFMDMFVQNCKLYDWGINVGGGRGVLSFNNCKFFNLKSPNLGGATLVNINNTYGGLFDGTIALRDIEIIKEDLDVSLIKIHYVEKNSTRGVVKMPNVIIDNVVCRDILSNTKNVYLYTLSGNTDNKSIKRADSIYAANILSYANNGNQLPIKLIKDSSTKDMYGGELTTKIMFNNFYTVDTDGGVIFGNRFDTIAKNSQIQALEARIIALESKGI